MLIVNTETISDKTIVENLGQVLGSTVQSRSIGRYVMASLKTLVGGECRGDAELLEEPRTLAPECPSKTQKYLS